MAISAALVKQLRDETGAPMMECKGALEEAGGDYSKAKDLLRQKGQAAAAKRAGRATGEGVSLVASNEDGTAVGGIVLECETDFVAKNEEFLKLANELVKAFVDNDPGSDPLAVKLGDKTVGDRIQEGIALIRENIVLAKAVRVSSPDGVATYVHHDKKKASIVTLQGNASNRVEIGKKVAIQVVALSPIYLKKDDVPADIIAKELETETQRAINEGKKEDIAKSIAQGRVNKEFFQSSVLLEQPFYENGKISVGNFVAEEAKAGGGTLAITGYSALIVGAADNAGTPEA